MFQNNQNQHSEKVAERFIVCYDKFTKPMAISIRNSLHEEASCAIWNEKQYESNEVKLTNRNHLILLSEKMIESNLSNPCLKPIKFSEGVLLKRENNTIGIYIDKEYDLGSFKKKFSESWKKYLLGIVIPILIVGGIPGAVITNLCMYFRDKKKVKFRLLFDAVNKLKANNIEKLFGDGQLV